MTVVGLKVRVGSVVVAVGLKVGVGSVVAVGLKGGGTVGG